jgi:hypothetical protein
VSEYDFDLPPLKRECASCGISTFTDSLNLCDSCRKAYDDEAAEWQRMEQLDDDLAATRRFYNG